MHELAAPEAIVIALGNGRVTVSVPAVSVCRRCAEGRGCGAGIFGADRKARSIDVPVMAGLDLEVGDRVRLALAPARLLRAAWLVYGLPLVSMVVAVVIADVMPSPLVGPDNDLFAVLFAATGLALGALLGRRATQRAGCLHRLVPVVAERVAPRIAGGPP